MRIYAKTGGRGGFKARHLVATTGFSLASLLAVVPSRAVEIDLGPDWKVHWDNTIQYNFGFRAQSIDSGIGSNPLFSESDYKFPNVGSVVTNRAELLSEFDAQRTLQNGSNVGFRLSGSLWKDFAYNDDVDNHSGDVAPGTPYTSLNSYSNNTYSNRTQRYYVEGAQLLDAFVFDNFNVAGHDASVKFGRLTEYWGNALIFGAQGINYSQNASDNIKGSAAPGTQAQELAIPRLQALASFQVTPDLVVEGQYFGEFYGNRLPEGGTYLGTAGFLFEGPELLEGALPRTDTIRPGDTHANYGIKLGWAPAWLRGSVGLYFRHLDETQPWAPLFAGANLPGAGIVPTNYHLAYPTNVKLLGVSLDRQIGDYSTGFEVSYRNHTGLNSTPLNLAQTIANGSSSGSQGATGDTLNVIANVVGGLTPNPLWETGSFFAELSFTHKLSVTGNAGLYNGVENSGPTGGCPTGNKFDGCSTNNAVAIAGQFDPTWPEVFPGVDLDAPIFLSYGVYGNAASLGTPVGEGDVDYTVGIHALIRQVYNITLQYNGYTGPSSNGLTNLAAAKGVPVGTPGFPSYYTSGNGTYFYSDKGWVSLTLRVTF